MAQERVRHGRTEQATLGIADAQSVKNAEPAQEKGYDAGKKVSGIKRHVTVDILGLPLAIHVTTAAVGDRQGGLDMLARQRDTLSDLVKLLVDGGYTGENFAQGVAETLGDAVEVEVVKRPELHQFAVMPKRWIVERSFAWLEKCRRLWKNCERKLTTSRQFVVLAFLTLLPRRL